MWLTVIFYPKGVAMKHITWRVLSLTLLALSSPALTIHEEDNAWQSNVGLNFNFARYRFGDLPTLNGYLAGIHWDLSHSWPSNWFVNLQFDGEWNAGPVSADNCSTDCDCNGNPIAPTDLQSSIRDFRPEFDFGWNFSFCENENFTLTPFIGLGFLYLSNKLCPQDVRYRYYNLNVPIGLSATWYSYSCECSDFDMGLAITYRIDAWTRLKLSLPDLDMDAVVCVDPCNCDCPNTVTTPSNVVCNDDCDDNCNKLKLKRTNGVHVAMPMRWNFDTKEDMCINMQAKVVPFFDWNSFGRTKEVNANLIPVPVPKLKQWYLGLHVDVGINF